ncbi:hypothetical protein [Cellulomonas wangsupingiae]|uniref:hypothetical protein n=1 Tax=Cellulomonas wangsupingiae TaxID=2968085 RepID=UPI001D0F3167|nr:hypothetical protein [Cellulomonas wangsupingiae]MCM0640632.1 hypothetical protein [Cellulomonas wangsupingiae]
MAGSDALGRAGASWDEGPGAGAWIGARLGEFGQSVGHAVPHGYDAYAVVPLRPHPEHPDHLEDAHATLGRVLDALAPVTGDQPVHCGLWEGWGFLFDHGADPRYAPGMGALVGWGAAEPRPDAEELERARAAAREAMASRRVERPAAEPLHLPHRAYHLWTGPLRAALALAGLHGDPPSLVWPDDRTWFVGVPIYTRELAVGGPGRVVDALLADLALGARRAAPDDLLDVDD